MAAPNCSLTSGANLIYFNHGMESQKTMVMGSFTLVMRSINLGMLKQQWRGCKSSGTVGKYSRSFNFWVTMSRCQQGKLIFWRMARVAF